MQIAVSHAIILYMLADTLKLINQAEDKADNLIAKANQTVHEIEQRTYQQIEELNAQTEQDIAAAVAALPTPEPAPVPTVKYDVPEQTMTAAVDYIVRAFYGD